MASPLSGSELAGPGVAGRFSCAAAACVRRGAWDRSGASSAAQSPQTVSAHIGIAAFARSHTMSPDADAQVRIRRLTPGSSCSASVGDEERESTRVHVRLSHDKRRARRCSVVSTASTVMSSACHSESDDEEAHEGESGRLSVDPALRMAALSCNPPSVPAMHAATVVPPRKKQRRRLAFSVFVSPDDHPDMHMMRHLDLAAAATDTTTQRERCARLAQLLSSHPLFRVMAPELARRVYREFVRERREAGSVIYAAGQRSDVFFLIDSGEVVCSYDEDATGGADAAPVLLHKHAGDTLGDLSLMQPCDAAQLSTARVSASGPCWLYSIDGCIYRYIVQHGMQERYQQLKSFFQSLPILQASYAQAEVLEQLVESAHVLEFQQGEVIVPAAAGVSPQSSPLSSPASTSNTRRLSDTRMDCTAATDRSVNLPSPTLLDRPSSAASSSSSAFSVALSACPPAASPMSMPCPSPSSPASSTSVAAPAPSTPSYLSSCVFIVQQGSVTVTYPAAPAAAAAPVTLGERELFGLEILSCPHRLLDLSSRSRMHSPAVTVADASPAPPASLSYRHSCSSSSSSSSSSCHPSSRKRVRLADGPLFDDLSPEPVSFTCTPPAAVVAAAPVTPVRGPVGARTVRFESPSSAAHSPVKRAPAAADMATTDDATSQRSPSPASPPAPSAAAPSVSPLSACSCRGEVRCASAGAVVLAIDALVWKSAVMRAI